MKDTTKVQTLGQQANKASRQRVFFGLLLMFMASTSFVFGMIYLDAFWYAMLGQFKFIPEHIQGILFSVLGGVVALLLTTFSYTSWRTIKLNDCTTSAQFKIARTGEYVALLSDFGYSALSLITIVMGSRIAADLLTRLEWISVGIFIAITITHACLRHFYEANDIQVVSILTETKMSAEQATESLLFRELVQTQALALASNNLQSSVDTYSEIASAALMTQLLSNLPQAHVQAHQANNAGKL